MKTKKRAWQSLLLTTVTILALMMPQTVLATGGTDGTELQVAEPASLEIQLGADWSGVEFELKTDAGVYPGDVIVGEDGVLRLEIGGSKNYILTCMNSTVQVPEPEQAPAITEETTQSTETENEDISEESTVAGIPTIHLILFGGGMVIAVGTLIGLYMFKRRSQSSPQYQDDDDEDE